MGLKQSDVEVLIAGRTVFYQTVDALTDADVPEAALERLADTDAFNSMGLDRRKALWQTSTKDKPTAIFQRQSSPDKAEENVSLPKLTTSEHLVQDHEATALSLRPHAVSFRREKLRRFSILSNTVVQQQKDGQFVKISGIVTVRQRPGTAKGVVFMTI